MLHNSIVHAFDVSCFDLGGSIEPPEQPPPPLDLPQIMPVLNKLVWPVYIGNVGLVWFCKFPTKKRTGLVSIAYPIPGEDQGK